MNKLDLLKNKKLTIVFLVILLLGLYFVLNNRLETKPTLDKKERTLNSQTQSVGEVQITVAPKNLEENSSTWDFEVILDTHSGSLDQDLAKEAVLLDDKQNEHRPLSWEGDPPGGHHRKGILKFKAISPRPDSVELVISGFAEKKTFSWDL